ncbi:2-methylcitrate dehydratase 2 [Arthrobacter sp. Hiyo8]|nr:2-methylcitrate dehydratase 2 [Arthrobacter sp. Hiyo8]
MRASDKAYAALREDIIEWRLAPGTVLAEVEQSERLGVSRTPVREALGRLSAEGLTTAAGGRGVVVTDISLEDIDELFELRETLEGKAAALAAVRGERPVFERLHAELLRARRCSTTATPHGTTTTPSWEGWMRRSTRPSAIPTSPRPCGACASTSCGSAASRPTTPNASKPPRPSTPRSPKPSRQATPGSPKQPPPSICTAVFPTSKPPTHLTKRSTMVKNNHVRVYKSEESLPREQQLAHKIAAVAADPVEVLPLITEMVINRIIDNASVAVASLNRARSLLPGRRP